MGRKRIPPPLLDDGPSKKRKHKEEPGPAALSDVLNAPFRKEPKHEAKRPDVPKRTTDPKKVPHKPANPGSVRVSVGKPGKGVGRGEVHVPEVRAPAGGGSPVPKAPEGHALPHPKEPDLTHLVDYHGGRLVVRLHRRAYVLHDVRDGTVTITEKVEGP